jgi:hypothetical protein
MEITGDLDTEAVLLERHDGACSACSSGSVVNRSGRQSLTSVLLKTGS